MTTDTMTITVDVERAEREVQAVRQVAVRLQQRFPQVPSGEVEAVVAAQYRSFDDSRIRDFVPIFVERNARAELLGRSTAA